MDKIKIAVGSDHAGYQLKSQIIEWLEDNGYKVEDFGTKSDLSVDYPDYIHPLSCAIAQNHYNFGIVICGTGNGAAMSANRHKLVRAAVCWQPELAELAKKHNNANIISLPARFINFETSRDIINAYLSAEFEGGRHQARIDKIELK